MGLEKAQLTPESGPPIPGMFNPAEISLSKSNSWKATESKGTNAPTLEFQAGTSATISLNLVFDTSLTGQDVSTHTNKLFDLMKVDPSLPGATSSNNAARPPWVKLEWGSTHTFKAVLERLAVRYTYFDDRGTPLRAKADLSLKQYEDEESYPLQNPTSFTPRPHRTHTLVAGDTLDRLAARYYRDATAWRRIAEANRVLDPLELPIGGVLVIPEPAVRNRG